MVTIVRFAPSPTGFLHIGNARTALFNWLFKVQNDGKFILRLDDTDSQRSREEYVDMIVKDLHWLGIVPDSIQRQSERFDRYHDAVDKLRKSGLIYPCYETPEELDHQRKFQMKRGLPTVYDRSALLMSNQSRQNFEKEGRRPYWRFLLPNYKKDPIEPERTEIHWSDLIKSDKVVDLSSTSDPILIRDDGSYLYTLPSVVDDIDMGVSKIIRGDDHITNTATQIALFRALKAPVPDFAHHNMLTTADGEGLSKRLGSMSLQQFRKDDYEPMAIASLATLIGTSKAVEVALDMTKLATTVSLTDITRSPAKFNIEELESLNKKLVHELQYDEVIERLRHVKADGGKTFWNAIRSNISHVNDAKIWFDVIRHASPVIDAEDRDFVNMAANFLPEEPWNNNSWAEWTDALKVKTRRKGKLLFMPLRKALTGYEHGPELAALLPLIGRKNALFRLSSET